MVVTAPTTDRSMWVTALLLWGCLWGVMEYRNLDLGHVLELSLPIGIPFPMMGCTSAVPGVLRMTAEITVIYQHPSTKWINATRHKNDRIPVAQVN